MKNLKVRYIIITAAILSAAVMTGCAGSSADDTVETSSTEVSVSESTDAAADESSKINENRTAVIMVESYDGSTLTGREMRGGMRKGFPDDGNPPDGEAKPDKPQEGENPPDNEDRPERPEKGDTPPEGQKPENTEGESVSFTISDSAEISEDISEGDMVEAVIGSDNSIIAIKKAEMPQKGDFGRGTDTEYQSETDGEQPV